MRALDLARRATFEAATFGWRWPSVVLPLSRAVRHGEVVDDQTELVVEGFARSGNSLAVAAIAAAQPREIRIAHHVHAPAHVLDAVGRGKPTLVVIREPGAAALAVVESKPFLTLDAALRGWVRFHDPLVPVRDRIVFATWEQVHEDLARVVQRLNERFRTAFIEPDARALEDADPEAYFASRTGRGVPLIGRTIGVDSESRPHGAASDRRLRRAVERYRTLVGAP